MAFGRRRSAAYQASHDVAWLVAGLGNPGPQYEDTPHNVGFRVIEALRERGRVPSVAKHEGLFGVGTLNGVDDEVALLMPLTFMNLSGRSVKAAMRSVGLTDPAALLVVHDEIDLPFGTIQLKAGGGHAGHNGLRSIADSLATRDFVRLRVGVGRPGEGDRRPIRDWILSSWDQSPAEVSQLVDDAAEAAVLVLQRGTRAAMNLVNARG
jgi:PTH1 family peptidyl-tRNA hydrolase